MHVMSAQLAGYDEDGTRRGDEGSIPLPRPKGKQDECALGRPLRLP